MVQRKNCANKTTSHPEVPTKRPTTAVVYTTLGAYVVVISVYHATSVAIC